MPSDLESAHVLPALMHKCYLAKSTSAFAPYTSVPDERIPLASLAPPPHFHPLSLLTPPPASHPVHSPACTDAQTLAHTGPPRTVTASSGNERTPSPPSAARPGTPHGLHHHHHPARHDEQQDQSQLQFIHTPQTHSEIHISMDTQQPPRPPHAQPGAGSGKGGCW